MNLKLTASAITSSMPEMRSGLTAAGGRNSASARLATGTDDGQVEPMHLRECGACRVRYDAFSAWLEEVRTDATNEADGYFPPERLGVQQQQIFRRLEALERPARVIAFPRQGQPTAIARRGPQRWIAAAAAAGAGGAACASA